MKTIRRSTARDPLRTPVLAGSVWSVTAAIRSVFARQVGDLGVLSKSTKLSVNRFGSKSTSNSWIRNQLTKASSRAVADANSLIDGSVMISSVAAGVSTAAVSLESAENTR